VHLVAFPLKRLWYQQIVFSGLSCCAAGRAGDWLRRCWRLHALRSSATSLRSCASSLLRSVDVAAI
jgi:hypothetical protein